MASKLTLFDSYEDREFYHMKLPLMSSIFRTNGCWIQCLKEVWDNMSGRPASSFWYTTVHRFNTAAVSGSAGRKRCLCANEVLCTQTFCCTFQKLQVGCRTFFQLCHFTIVSWGEVHLSDGRGYFYWTKHILLHRHVCYTCVVTHARMIAGI